MSSKRRIVPLAAVLLFLFIVSVSMFRGPQLSPEAWMKKLNGHSVTNTAPKEGKSGQDVMENQPVANPPPHKEPTKHEDAKPAAKAPAAALAEKEKEKPAAADSSKSHSDSSPGHASSSKLKTQNQPYVLPEDAARGKSLQRVTTSVQSTHREVHALSTDSGVYFPVIFGSYKAINPNFIPHPQLPNKWFIVAQADKRPTDSPIWFTELVCLASFKDGALACEREPLILPIPFTETDQCKDDLAFWNFNVGPHDARVFYGPDRPYIVYGTQSKKHCFGQYVQDFRFLVEWPDLRLEGVPDHFLYPTDIVRPPPHLPVEKNWFLFWDNKNQTYVHYDIGSSADIGGTDRGRGYSKLLPDGSTEPNIATAVDAHDRACWSKHSASLDPSMPKDIHQATNSLSVTLCKRADPTCKRTDENTIIMEIFHRKSFVNWHGRYEPFVMTFKSAHPFQLHGFSTKPIWLNGRKDWVEEKAIKEGVIFDYVKDQTEMIYVTSLAWKKAGQTYHGYLDDVMFLAFGVEDRDTAGMDLLAGDLLQDILECSS